MTHEERLWDLFKAMVAANSGYMTDIRAIAENARAMYEQAQVCADVFDSLSKKHSKEG